MVSTRLEPGGSSSALDRLSAAPMYKQLKSLIADDILHERLQPGDAVGSESELSRRYEISRITVRQALHELQADGLIVRIVGKGTFVAKRPLGRQPRLGGFGEDMRALGLTPSYRTLVVETRLAPPEIAELLEISTRTEVLYIDRLLHGNEVLLARARSYVPLRLAPDVLGGLTAERLDRESFYGILEAEAGLLLQSASERIEPLQADEVLAEEIQIEVGDLALGVDRTVFDNHGRPCEHDRIIYASSRYELRIELSRPVQRR